MPTFGVDLGALEALDLDGVLDCFFLSREAVGVVAMLLRAVDDITALFQRTKGWIEGVDRGRGYRLQTELVHRPATSLEQRQSRRVGSQ